MQTRLILAFALVLAAAPLAYAHDPAGIPKNYCESLSEWNTHEYGPGGPGFVLAFFMDGNMVGDCSGGSTINPGVPCLGIDPADPLNSVLVGLCGSEIDPPIADYDGHSEYAVGGAWILSCPSDCGPLGGGTLECFGEEAHHASFGPFEVYDAVLGTGGGTVWVATDWTNPVDADPCGDLVSDTWVGFAPSSCPCYVTFLAGLDGSYWVYTTGGQGHVLWDFGSGDGGGWAGNPDDPVPPIPASADPPPRSNSGSAGGHA
jgi:hypothetical protein